MKIPRSVVAVVFGSAVVLSLGMGLRHSLGIFMPNITRGIGISVAEFTLAIAVQNLSWGLLQPFAGVLAVRIGYRRLMMCGVFILLAGLVVLATAQGSIAVMIGAGIAIGMAMACAGPAICMSVAARAVPAAVRSTVLGMVSAAGSLGSMLAAPLGQSLMQAHGWRWGVAGFVMLAAFMIPAVLLAGRIDRIADPPTGGASDEKSAMQAVAMALRNPYFVVMTLAYFVCGMQLIFLTTHLPSYLDICGMDPMLSAKALGLIGAFNVLGSLFFGWAGGRWSKFFLLGTIYFLRSCALCWYFLSVATPASTMVFASIMGFLWLGVSPLIQGWIVDTFGLKWQAMLGGVAFVSHQLGSFVGAFGGGMLYMAMGNYDAAWKIGVGVGLLFGLIQIAFSFKSNSQPPQPPPPLSPSTPSMAT